MTKHLKAIGTKDASGQPTGLVLPIWNSAYDTDYSPEQVYLTTIVEGGVKGPHLHLKRAGAFTCIKGDVLIVTRENGEYRQMRCGDQWGYKTVHVAPGVPCALYNVGRGEAFVLNMPTPPWRHDDQDEHEVKDWSFTLNG